MMTALKTTNNTKPTAPATKRIKARNNDPVFTYVDTGKYSANLLGYDVLLVRAKHDMWHCVDAETNDFLGDGQTRNQAMRDAYYAVVTEEAKRLDWVLANQPYRSYGGHKPRSSSAPAKAKRKEKVTPIHKIDYSKWRVIYSDMLKSYFYTSKDDVYLENLNGPFSSEEEMATAITRNTKEA